MANSATGMNVLAVEPQSLSWINNYPDVCSVVINFTSKHVALAKPTTLVCIKPKPQFLEFLGQAGSESRAPEKGENEGSDAEIASEPVLTGWWRRALSPVSLVRANPVHVQ